jgi:hypothetical protein
MTRGTITIGVAASGLLLVAGTVALSRKPIPPPCPAGRFLLPATAPVLVPDGLGDAPDVVIVADGPTTVAIASGCDAVPGTVKGTRKGTAVKGKWDTCGSASRVRVSARIALDCTTMTGTLRAKKVKPRRFTAVRSICGDGVLDPDAGEACEPGLVACPGDAACTVCTCASATTTSVATTTSSTATTGPPLPTTTSPPTTTVPATTSTTAGPTTTSTSTTTTSSLPGTPPPDPSTIAPPLPRGVVPSFATEVGFLYEGGIIQTGVAPGTIVPERVSVARGRVVDTAGVPLAGMRVTVLGHAELGQTITRADGRYDLAVNGGGTLTLRFTSPDAFEVQRPLTAGWNEWETIPDVVMTGQDPLVTLVSGGAGTLQMAQGSPVTDADGTRRVTVFFPPGTTAAKVMADGSTVALPTFHVRGTEYTVGDRGPAAMPGALPATSGYTYAVELSVDEAADAVGVEFNQPVTAIVDNFPGFPAGILVPLGSYNRQTGQWDAETDGRVVDLLGVTGGLPTSTPTAITWPTIRRCSPRSA